MDDYWIYGKNNCNLAPSPREIHHQATKVHMLLRAFDLCDRENDLRDDFQTNKGERWLTFESFDRIFPTFGWQMASKSFFHTDADNPLISIDRWFTKFEAGLVWSWYCRLREHYQDLCAGKLLFGQPVPLNQQNRPLAMAFPLKGVRGGLVIHNGPIQSESPLFRHRTVSLQSDGAAFQNVAVERYSSWLTALCKKPWTPEPLTDPINGTLRIKETHIVAVYSLVAQSSFGLSLFVVVEPWSWLLAR